MDDLQIDTGAEASSDVIIETGSEVEATDTPVNNENPAEDEKPDWWNNIPNDHPVVKSLNAIKQEKSLLKSELSRFKEQSERMLLEINQLRAAQQKAAQPQIKPEPVREAFSSESEFVDAQIAHLVEKLSQQTNQQPQQLDETSIEQKAAEILQRQIQEIQLEQFQTEAAQKVQTEYPEVYNFFESPENQPLIDAFLQNEPVYNHAIEEYGQLAPVVVYEALQAGDYDTILNGSPAKAAVALYNANQRLIAKTQQSQTQLPKPIGALKGTGRQPSDLDMDDREYFRQLQKSL